ncbi:MAG: ATP-binding cassette domain-containing protein [Methylobacteriaceae bacterium]|nr:ATP-binding cassette domain-containing protein [Methylobacteriaceae bacterium]
MLELQGVDVSIGATPILRGVSLQIPAGRMMGLIGRNGAGKTTLMRAIMGAVPARSGRVSYEHLDFASVPLHRRAHLGIGYMPEDRRLVPDLSVEDNVLAPAWATRLEGAVERLRWILDLIPEIKPLMARKAPQLSGGQQKLAALARALMVGRELLLLDEPSEGVAPALAHRIAEILSRLKGEGLTVFIAESNDRHIAGLIDGAYLIERGSVRSA